MKSHQKSLVGGLVVLFIGTSCCWISGLLIWLGAGTVFGALIHWLEIKQPLFIGAGLVLILISLFLYSRIQRNKKSE